MTIVRIQIDEKHDTIGLSVQKCRGATKKEAIFAKSVAGIAEAAINQALESFKNEKAKETSDAESK